MTLISMDPKLYIYNIYIYIINILPGATSNNLLGGFTPPEETI